MCDKGVAVIVPNFAVVVAVVIVLTCLAHEALHGERAGQI
jgi:hypothetical protein